MPNPCVVAERPWACYFGQKTVQRRRAVEGAAHCFDLRCEVRHPTGHVRSNLFNWMHNRLKANRPFIDRGDAGAEAVAQRHEFGINEFLHAPAVSIRHSSSVAAATLGTGMSARVAAGGTSTVSASSASLLRHRGCHAAPTQESERNSQAQDSRRRCQRSTETTWPSTPTPHKAVMARLAAGPRRREGGARADAPSGLEIARRRKSALPERGA